jgi:predicted Zn-dependent protease
MEEERAKQAADGNREQLELLERWVPEAPTAHQGDSTIWAARLRAVLAERRETAAEIAEEALRSCPGDPQLLLLAALAALLTGLPGRALVYLKRFHKRSS